MKKIGIIGGAGPLASALLYKFIIQENSPHLPEICLLNYPFTQALSVQDGYNHEIIIQTELAYCIDKLQQYTVDIGLLACNTLHLYLKNLSTFSIQFLSLPELVIQEAYLNGHRRLLVLGTENTCQSHLYQHPDLFFFYPSQEEQCVIHHIIHHLLKGQIDASDALTLEYLIRTQAQKIAFDAVILGCTELPLLHHHFPIRIDQPLYDSLHIPAKKIGAYL